MESVVFKRTLVTLFWKLKKKQGEIGKLCKSLVTGFD